MNQFDDRPVAAGPAVLGDSVSAPSSAVSWSAIFAGAATAAALSLILLMLGSGLSLGAVSPWAHSGVKAATFGVSAILWLGVTQLLASGMGGYLAGRLRTRWIGVHVDEVYFRDTVHGFLAWAVASLATAALLTSVIGSIVEGGAHAGNAGMAMAAPAGSTGEHGHAGGPPPAEGPMAYYVDALFRAAPGSGSAGSASSAGSDPAMAAPVQGSNAAASPPPPTREVERIFDNAIGQGNLPAEDAQYLGQVVAQRTGLSQQDADSRVRDTFARAQAKLHDAEATAQDAADKARKASAYTTLWLFISLLFGAFIASFAATHGGRRRDL